MRDLTDARLYLVAPAEFGGRNLADLVAELTGAGVDLIQLREKEMDAGDVLRVAEPIAHACRAAGVPFIVNDRPDVAQAVGADGVHVGQNDIPVGVARSIVGADAIVGLSTHRREEVDSGAATEADYIAVGPVYETPTKPGRPAAGLELIRYAAPRVERPWFAIGGIDEGDLPEVIDAGARRIVVVRAITEAADPPAAAARLKKMLLDAPG
ncbi:MAG: thiamine phosphate synthase [Actinomycetota bacterium]